MLYLQHESQSHSLILFYYASHHYIKWDIFLHDWRLSIWEDTVTMPTIVGCIFGVSFTATCPFFRYPIAVDLHKHMENNCLKYHCGILYAHMHTPCMHACTHQGLFFGGKHAWNGKHASSFCHVPSYTLVAKLVVWPIRWQVVLNNPLDVDNFLGDGRFWKQISGHYCYWFCYD